MTDNRTVTVDRFVEALDHPLKDGIERLRLAILASDAEITEQVKWKAPSFCYRGVDRVTFKLYPADRLELVFHRGAKVRADTESFVFDDPSGLLRWITRDRGVLTLRDLADVEAKQDVVVDLVNRWMAV